MTIALCKYCGVSITQHVGNAWHSTQSVLSQYCYVDPVRGSRLHEPISATRTQVTEHEPASPATMLVERSLRPSYWLEREVPYPYYWMLYRTADNKRVGEPLYRDKYSNDIIELIEMNHFDEL